MFINKCRSFDDLIPFITIFHVFYRFMQKEKTRKGLIKTFFSRDLSSIFYLNYNIFEKKNVLRNIFANCYCMTSFINYSTYEYYLFLDRDYNLSAICIYFNKIIDNFVFSLIQEFIYNTHVKSIIKEKGF
jgi:hypothetical protein